jgi:uncharacterized SAM-binding protein YcdF (DUF218 family)
MYAFFKTSLIDPFTLCLGILFVGIICLWMAKDQNRGRIITSLGFLLLWLSSLSVVADSLLEHLEQYHPSFGVDGHGGSTKFPQTVTPQEPEGAGDIAYVVVLAGGHALDRRLPISSQFTATGLVRLIEGIRLHKKIPNTQLILSGGVGRDPVSDAVLMRDLAVDLGVAEEDIILETESMSTFDEAKFIQPIVQDKKFLLVTSASHMPRSMGLFLKLGMKPLPAPTGHLVKRYGDGISLIPNSASLHKSYTAVYEIVGYLKERLLGRIE